MTGEDLADKVAPEQIPKGSEQASHMAFEAQVPGSGSSKSKISKGEISLSRNSRDQNEWREQESKP